MIVHKRSFEPTVVRYLILEATMVLPF